MTTSPDVRPTGWVLIAKDNTVAVPTLYATLRAACEAETTYRARTGQRALPTPVWSRNDWTFNERREADDAVLE